MAGGTALTVEVKAKDVSGHIPGIKAEDIEMDRHVSADLPDKGSGRHAAGQIKI